MNSLYKLSRKRVLILIGSFLFLVLFGVSSVAYLVNQYYREQLVEIENERFVEFFEHDFKFSGEESAIDLAKHYAHVNNLQLIITDDSDSIIYETEKPVEEFSIYSVEVNESLYSIKIDYSNSSILLVRDKEIMIMYYIIISVYTITIVYIVISRRLKNKRILSDLGQIEYLISNKQRMKNSFHYEELARLFDTFNEFSSKLDLLQEKRKDGFNALAHDLKTPITILLNHLDGITETDELFRNKEMFSLIQEVLADKPQEKAKIPSKNEENDNESLESLESLEDLTNFIKTNDYNRSSTICFTNEMYHQTNFQRFWMIPMYHCTFIHKSLNGQLMHKNLT